MENKPVIAFIYDFDGTLSPGNMQEYDFIGAVGNLSEDFWNENETLAKDQDADQVLTYMFLMLQKARAKQISLKKERFREFGKSVQLFDGVDEWFKRINKYGAKQGFEVQHFINSSGMKEMIEGTSIANEFKSIFACSYLYSVDGVAEWPAVAVNYTNKTQFLFKINKGITSVYDNTDVNRFIPHEQRAIPFSHMIYFGDGATDIPCMKLVKEQGGNSIAVYNPANERKKDTANQLIRDNRVNFVCPADYTKDSEIDKVVKTIIDKIKADDDFKMLQKRHKDNAV